MALNWVHGIEPVVQIQTDYFNYSSMTEGEFKLHLLAGQLRTLQAAHPDDQYFNLWKKGENYLLNAIHKGLHSTSGCIMPTGSVHKELYPVLEGIKRASNRFQSATKNGMFLHGRSSPSFGTNPLDQLEPFHNGINGYPYKEGCYYKYCNSNDNPCTSSITTGSDAECQRYEVIKDMLNQHLEDSSHHILYNFATDTQAAGLRATTNWKVGQHILAVSEMAKIAGVSVDNMTQWVQLGIMRHNAKRGAGALNAHDSIEALLQNPEFLLENSDRYKAQYGINGVNIIIPAAAYIIVACAIALIVVVALVQVLKGQEPTALDRVRGLATALFSPSGSDFTGGGTGGGGTNCLVGFTWNAAQNRCVANPPPPPPPSNGGGSNTGLIVGGAALLLFAMNNDK